MTLKMILAFLVSLFVAVLIGSALVPFLRKIKAGQEIREDGPTWHKSKAGTPTMGGVIILGSIVVTSLFYMKEYPKTEVFDVVQYWIESKK